MMTQDDHALLREFANYQSEAAFSALVRRHLPLVYSAALRRADGNSHLAEEIAQGVFILLARKAGSIGEKIILTGWLYRATQYAAANARRQNLRRQQREHEAYMESKLCEDDMSCRSDATGEPWKQLAPVLDEAMNALRTVDRDAVLMRYFENKPLAEVGAALGMNEDAARMRVNRALEKLHLLLTKKGVTLGATAIAGAMTASAVSAAPAALAGNITSAVLTGTGLTIATVAITTLQKIAVAAALAAAVGIGIFQAKEVHDARAEAQKLQTEQAPMADQLREMTMQHDKDTNMIASLKEELARNGENNSELLKLRGEVGLLKNQLVGSKTTRGEVQSGSANQKNQASALDAKTIELNKCLNNLRQIDAAMQEYGLEHNLSGTNIVTAEDILPFLPSAEIPQCPSGGTYTFGKMDEVPSCSVPGHALPPSVDSPAMGLKFGMLKSAIERDRYAAITSADIKTAIQSYKQFHNGQSPQSQGEWMLYLTAYGSKYQAAMEAYMSTHNNQTPTNVIELLAYWQN